MATFGKLSTWSRAPYTKGKKTDPALARSPSFIEHWTRPLNTGGSPCETRDTARPHYGERISTGFVASTVNQVVSKHMVKKQVHQR
jgi:hypothetical protein